MKKDNKLLGVQILRVVACLMVFVVHFGQRTGVNSVFAFTDYGQYGVYLFFLISGFLMCQSLMKGSLNRGEIKRYYIKRAIRILPLYYLSIIWFFITEELILDTMPQDDLRIGWFRYFFLLNTVVKNNGFATYHWGNIGITWTIPVFVFAYLISPLVCKWVKNANRASVAFGVSLAVSVLADKVLNGWIMPLQYMHFFVLGIMLWHYLNENKEREFAIVCSVLWIVADALQVLPILKMALVFAILTGAMCKINLSVPDKIRNLIEVVDEHSYTLYLMHGIVFCSVIDKLQLSWWINAMIAIIGSFVLTVVVHQLYEKPVTKWLEKKCLNNK